MIQVSTCDFVDTLAQVVVARCEDAARWNDQTSQVAKLNEGRRLPNPTGMRIVPRGMSGRAGDVNQQRCQFCATPILMKHRILLGLGVQKVGGLGLPV